MKNRSFMTILAVTVITAMLTAGCGSSNAGPAKEDAAETVQTTAEEAIPADDASAADTAVDEVPSAAAEGETGSETDAVEKTTTVAAAQEEVAEPEQAQSVTAEPQEGDTVVTVYEGNEINAVFCNMADGQEYPQESQGEYVYDIMGLKCLFEKPVAPGRIDYEKLPEEWQSMIRTAYMVNTKESEQDTTVIPEPEEGDVTTVILEDGKEITVTFKGMDGEDYVYEAEGIKVTTGEVLEKGTITFKDLPMGWTQILRTGF